MSSFSSVARLHLPSGHLSISDSSYFFDFPLIVDLAPRTYVVEVARTRVNGMEINERARVSDGLGVERTGAVVGRVQIEFAQVGLCDRSTLESAFASSSDDEIARFTSQLSDAGSTGIAQFAGGATMILVKPGFCDRDFAVHELLRGTTRCGVEAVFI